MGHPKILANITFGFQENRRMHTFFLSSIRSPSGDPPPLLAKSPVRTPAPTLGNCLIVSPGSPMNEMAQTNGHFLHFPAEEPEPGAQCDSVRNRRCYNCEAHARLQLACSSEAAAVASGAECRDRLAIADASALAK